MNKVQTRLNTLKGEISPVFSPLPLAPFLDQTLRVLSKKLPRLNVALTCPEAMTIRSDPDFLTKILENLLLNAVEAGIAGGEIKVQIRVAAASAQEIEITLTDNGPGIPSELLPDRLFEPFATSKERGSGIGLWQVKRMVESLGGVITAANNDHEGGGCFRLCLPRTTANHQKVIWPPA
jgi:signal transduction histidine kinase